ncbi:hypothetical protein CBS147346_8787 [Aspergillus niger]|nr:hypothetical protein CBS147346_8787 [Aspergillus niger]
MCVDIASRLVYAWEGRAVAGSQARTLARVVNRLNRAKIISAGARLREDRTAWQEKVSDGGSVFIRSR